MARKRKKRKRDLKMEKALQERLDAIAREPLIFIPLTDEELKMLKKEGRI